MTDTDIDSLEWVEVQATAHVSYGRQSVQVGDVLQVNVKDYETRMMVKAGLLVILDPETRKLLGPTTLPGVAKRGCGCG